MPRLLELLDDDDTRVHAAALTALGAAVDADLATGIEDEFLSRLDSDDVRVRMAAVLGMGLTASPEAGQALLELARCSDAGHALVGERFVPDPLRLMAALALALGDHPTLVTPILETAEELLDDRHELAALLIASLGSMPSARTPAVHAWLVKTLRNRRLEPVVRGAIPTALSHHGDGSATAALLDVLARSDTDAPVAQSCMLALGALANPADGRATRALLELVLDAPDVGTREFAWLALARVASKPGAARVAPEFVADVATLLRRQLEKPRRGADRPFIALASGLFGRQLSAHRPALRDALLEAFEDMHDPAQRGVLALAMGLLGDDAVVPSLRHALQETHHDAFRGHAAVALGLLADAGSAPLLRELATQPGASAVLRDELALALRLLGDDEAWRQLAAAMSVSSNARDRDGLAQALGTLRDVRAASALENLLEERGVDVTTRLAACRSLGRLAEKTLVPWRAVVEIDANPHASAVDLARGR